MTVTVFDVARVMGEIHVLIVSACCWSPHGWLTAPEIFEITGISGVDFHHALAELIFVGICTVKNGIVRTVDVVPQPIADFFTN
tara:strand:- start:604 stop:855 length:252 start_codon:yes stop_codon:yes gene_type:complete